MRTKVKTYISLVSTFIFGFVFQKNAHALVIGVPIVAITVLKLSVVFISILSVPLTAFIHFIKKGSKKRSFLISGGVLLVLFAISYLFLVFLVGGFEISSLNVAQRRLPPRSDLERGTIEDRDVAEPGITFEEDALIQPFEKEKPSSPPTSFAPEPFGQPLRAPYIPLEQLLVIAAVLMGVVFAALLVPLLLVNFSLHKLLNVFERKKSVLIFSLLLGLVLAVIVSFVIISIFTIQVNLLVI